MAERWQPLHVATMLVVADVDRSAALYCDLLRFEIRERQPGLIPLTLGSMLAVGYRVDLGSTNREGGR